MLDVLTRTPAMIFLVILGGALLLALWGATRRPLEFRDTPVRRIPKGANVRVRYTLPTVSRTTDETPTTRSLELYGTVEEVRGDTLYLTDRTQIDAADLHGTAVAVWRR